MAVVEILNSEDYRADKNTIEMPAVTEEELNQAEDQWLCDMSIDLSKLSDQIEYEYSFRLPVMVLAKLTINDLNAIRELNYTRVRTEEEE